MSSELPLAEMVEMIVGLASNDFSCRMAVGDGSRPLDAVAAGLNMVAEELERRQRRDRELAARVVQAERLAAVGQLAAGVAHEVNNPASFILANDAQVLENLRALDALAVELSAAFPDGSPEAAKIAALLERHRLREQIAASTDMLQDSLAGMERVVTIVSHLRGFSRIESERVEPIDVEQVVNESCKLVQKQATYRARLTRRLTAVPRVNADRGRLIQVLTNLLVNALQAIPEGAPEANEIGVGTDFHAGEVRVWVRDTGSGMGPDVMARVFEPFFTTKAKDGTGLGLSIAAEIVRSYSGFIDAESTPGKGTCFTVHLPALDRATESLPRSAPLAASSAAAEVAPRARILVVDDEIALLKVYERMLEGHHDVTVASGGREAIALLAKAGPFDVIICDMMMPEVDGMAVYDAIRAKHPELEPRIGFTTGGTYTPLTQAFSERHAARLLHKPTRKAQLEEMIAKLLNGR